jgi:protein-S-isoprenylcysteine O-methyltransferase Ste14
MRCLEAAADSTSAFFMTDVPAILLTATVWAYWLGVGVMVVRARRRTRKLGGLIPEQGVERLMWVVWVPLVAAWILLPTLSLSRTRGPLALPEFAQTPMLTLLRLMASLLAMICLALTIECWKRMGKSWSMAIVHEKSELVTTGLYRFVRHPIYALSVSLMLLSVVILPTVPMVLVAFVHVVLMNLKSRNEERYLLATHGEVYQRYLNRTGRFVPRRTRSR